MKWVSDCLWRIRTDIDVRKGLEVLCFIKKFNSDWLFAFEGTSNLLSRSMNRSTFHSPDFFFPQAAAITLKLWLIHKWSLISQVPSDITPFLWGRLGQQWFYFQVRLTPKQSKPLVQGHTANVAIPHSKCSNTSKLMLYFPPATDQFFYPPSHPNFSKTLSSMQFLFLPTSFRLQLTPNRFLPYHSILNSPAASMRLNLKCILRSSFQLTSLPFKKH